MTQTTINDFSLLCRLFGNLFYRSPADPILTNTFSWLAQAGLRQQWALTVRFTEQFCLKHFRKKC